MECSFKKADCFANSSQNLCYCLAFKPHGNVCPFFKTREEAGGTAQDLERKAHEYVKWLEQKVYLR